MKKDIKHNIIREYVLQFRVTPIMSFAPGRINLIGEHTDYNNGYVFPAAIKKGIYCAIQKSDADYCTVYSYDKRENMEFGLDNIKPIPGGDWRNYVLGIVYQIQQKGKNVTPFNLVFGGDIPGGSGLSSSAALENSIVFGLNELFQLGLTKKQMILISQKAEHEFAGVHCGIMDQYASMFGKRDRALLLDCDTLRSTLVQPNWGDFELVLINSHVHHELAESAYNERRELCERVCDKLDIPSLASLSEIDINDIQNVLTEDELRKASYIILENERVIAAFHALKTRNLRAFGDLMYTSHHGMSRGYQISCVEIDFLVNAAQTKEAIIGSRMMGGGFGGCTLNLIRKGNRKIIDEICASYVQEFNLKPSVIPVELGDGAKLINNE